MKFAPPSSSGSPRALGQFRSDPKRRAPLHPAESALLWIVGAHLVFLPWALGSTRWWAQLISLGFAIAAIAISLLPRTYAEELTNGRRFRLYPAPKLLRFPFFWLGLVYAGIVLIQIANPAWTYMESKAGWWIEPVEYVSWLPHGVADMPFHKMNAWRTLMIHGAVWLVVCALWIGVTRRAAARTLLTVIAVNGAALAIVAILQRLTNTKLLLWHWPAPSNYFVATFVYKNHAGAFFLLATVLCAGLAWWHADRGRQRLTKSHPGAVFLFLTCLMTFGLLLTYARASTALGLLGLVVIGLSYIVHVLFASRGGSPPLVTVAMAAVTIGFLGACVHLINTDKVWAKFERLFNEDRATSIEHRQLATRATWDMAQESLAVGHGAGAFRFVFPRFQQHYPEIFAKNIQVKKETVPRRLYWEHAHNDYVEFLAEFGLVGVGWLTACLVVVLAALRRFRVFSQPARVVMLSAPFLVVIAAIADFPLHNPAILTTAVAIVTLVLLGAQLDQRRPSRM